MLGSLAYVVLISTKVISKITVTHISTILRLIFVDFDNPAQRKRCEFSKSYARKRWIEGVEVALGNRGTSVLEVETTKRYHDRRDWRGLLRGSLTDRQ